MAMFLCSNNICRKWHPRPVADAVLGHKELFPLNHYTFTDSKHFGKCVQYIEKIPVRKAVFNL